MFCFLSLRFEVLCRDVQVLHNYTRVALLFFPRGMFSLRCKACASLLINTGKNISVHSSVDLFVYLFT